MRNETRQQFAAFLQRQKELNGVDLHASDKITFTVDPTVAQVLEEKIAESSAFLSQINHIGVDQQSGKRVGLAVGTPLASTTLTPTNKRAPRDPVTMAEKGYLCTQTNTDISLSYQRLDSWRHKPNFQTLWRDLITKQMARDRIMIGFNGKKRADTSNLATNAKLEDVNRGWIQAIFDEAMPQTLGWDITDPTKPKAKPVTIGDVAGTAYKNLDALVLDAHNSIIKEWYQNDTNLVVITGAGLINDKYLSLVNDAKPATEQVARDLLLTNRQLGGFRTVQVPFFPANTLLITSLDNLSIYTQNGTRRRTIIDQVEFDRVADFNSVNEAYVVEDYEACALIQNIEIK